jgi:hypothetical protein
MRFVRRMIVHEEADNAILQVRAMNEKVAALLSLVLDWCLWMSPQSERHWCANVIARHTLVL